MLRIPVKSSDVISVGYDGNDRLLEVEFHGGRVYRYRNVEPEMHAQFMKADSYGQFLFSYINGRYRYEKVAEGEDAAGTRTDTIAFVTSNAIKMRHLALACEPFGIQIEQLELPVDEIQSDDPQEVAVKKAKNAYDIAKRPVIVNDTYWNILALRGFPGAYMSSVSRWLRVEDFLSLMKEKTDRTIILTGTVVYHDGRRTKVFTKDYSGVIIDEPRGSGSSITQLVMMNGSSKTIAELYDMDEPGHEVGPDLFQEVAKWLRLQKRLGK